MRGKLPKRTSSAEFTLHFGLLVCIVSPLANFTTMHIKQVIIRGFKTYKDQTSLSEDFSPGTNVVVGFNGSGKSNFFNAILFVLSDQYTNLRAESRKALLHEGAGQAVLTAFVEVILDNTDRRIPVENAQVSIRRLIGIKKDDWLLDGRHSTRAEIFGLLEGAGFAKTSPYYIVQQGKVSELTLMTDAQRLGLLKDISGAGIYDERRAESVKIMEDTALRRTRTEALITEIEKKLATLEEEQRELRECETLETRRRTLEYVLADIEWRGAQEQIEELSARRSEASGKLVELQTQLGSVKKMLCDSETDLQRREDEKLRLAQRAAFLEAERDRKFEAVTKVRLDADEGSRRRKESEEHSAARMVELERARKELAVAAADVDSKRSLLSVADTSVRDIDQRCQISSAKREHLLARQSRRQQYKSVDERNKALDEEVRRRIAQLKQGRRSLDECAHKLQQANEHNRKSSERCLLTRKELAEAEKQLGRLNHKMRGLNEELDAESEKMRLLHQERSRATQNVDHVRRSAQSDQHRLDSTLPRGYRQAVTAIMRWSEEQGLQDRICGPLLMHIQVSSTFRAAVESFAGMALFNILATDDDVAAQAVKFVRMKRLGTIVVTPLNELSVKHFHHPQIDGVKPLVDVVRCPDWVLPAVQQIFGKGVVCRSMELCEEISKAHGIDAITLEGDRVSRRGVVTGGYQDPGRFVRISLAESIRQSQARVCEAEQSLPETEDKIRGASEHLNSLHAQRLVLQQERDEVRAKMLHLAEQVQGLEETSSKCMREMGDLEDWKHRMEVLISECEASIDAKKSELSTTSLSGLSPDDELILRQLTTEVGELSKSLEVAKSQQRQLKCEMEDHEAQIISRLRRRVRDLESEAASSSQDRALEQADEAANLQVRLEREHREVTDGAASAQVELQTISAECEAGRKGLEDLAADEQRIQELAAQANVQADQLTVEQNAQVQRKAEVDARLRSLTAPSADVEKCRLLPKSQLLGNLAAAIKALQAFDHVNRTAVEQYENFAEQLADLQQRKEDIDAGEMSIADALQKIDAQKEMTLLQTLDRVNEHFQQVFTEMVPGGRGRLQVIREVAPEESQTDSATKTSGDATPLGELRGVKMEVSFTGQANSYLLMNQLSGGQKTVVALSLIFSIQRLEPAPFYLLDEVDAALDASYRSALANLIAKTASSSQVVMTTFRPEALEMADRCYRVYQQNRASRIDAVTRDQAKQVLVEQDRLAQASAGI